MKQEIKILLVDDQALFREGLRTLLSTKDEFKVVGEASNGEEALLMTAKYHPHVILMDLRMPVMDGVTATERMKSQYPNCKVIVLTTFDDEEYVFDGLRAGAYGYLLKDVPSEKLFEAIFATARGEYFLLPSITAKVVAEFSRLPKMPKVDQETIKNPLSKREMEILRLISMGMSNKEIADNLVIAEGTVKNHVTSILSKMEVKDSDYK